jgi:hypothetical protein
MSPAGGQRVGQRAHPELADYQAGVLPNWPEILPAFVRVDCETVEVTPLYPRRVPRIEKKPEEFGDSWSDPLTAEDKAKIHRYFSVRESLRDHFEYADNGGAKTKRELLTYFGHYYMA